MIIVAYLGKFKDSRTKSHWYEWDSYSNAIMEIEIDVIHKYYYQLKEGQRSNIRSIRLGLHNTNHDSSEDDILTLSNLSSHLVNNLTELFMPVSRLDDNVMLSIEPSETLSILHLELVNWNQNEPSNLVTFPNSYTLGCYLNEIEPLHYFTSSTSGNILEEDIKSLSQKRKNKKKRFDSENYTVSVSQLKKVKIKEVSNGENLLKVPKDEKFDILLENFQERSIVLIESTQPINIGTVKAPQMVHIAQYLLEEENQQFIDFFK